MKLFFNILGITLGIQIFRLGWVPVVKDDWGIRVLGSLLFSSLVTVGIFFFKNRERVLLHFKKPFVERWLFGFPLIWLFFWAIGVPVFFASPTAIYILGMVYLIVQPASLTGKTFFGLLVGLSFCGETYFNFFLQHIQYVLLLFVPGFCLLQCITKIQNRSLLLALSPAVTILGLSLLYIFIAALNPPQVVFSIIFLGVFLTSLFVVLKNKVWRTGFDNESKQIFLLFLILSFVGVAFVVPNIFPDSAGKPRDLFIVIQNLYAGKWPLPSDLELPYKTAKVFIENIVPWTLPRDGWTMGDRPPLMGLWVAISHFVFLPQIEIKPNFFLSTEFYFKITVLLNSIFVIPLFIVLKKIFSFSAIHTYLLGILVCLSPFTFLNIYFAWPKMMGVYFVLLFVLLLLYSFKKTQNNKYFFISLGCMGILYGMGELSHGGAILSLPVLGLFLIWSLYRSENLSILQRTLGFLVFVLMYFTIQSPWIAYKKHFSEIDTFHLLYHYGTNSTEDFSTKNMIKMFIDFHSNLTFGEEWKFRSHNVARLIKELFEFDRPDMSISLFFNRNQKYFAETFFGINNQINAGLLLLAAFFSTCYICFSESKKKLLARIGSIAPFYFVFFIGFFSLILNTFLKWAHYTPHEGPYFELILMQSAILGIFLKINENTKYLLAVYAFLTFYTQIVEGLIYNRVENIFPTLGTLTVLFLAIYQFVLKSDTVET